MRMIISFVLMLSFAMLFSACKYENRNQQAFITQLGSDLQKARAAVEVHTNFLYHELENKVADPATRQRATIQNKKALRIKIISSEWKEYLQEVLTTTHPDPALLQTKAILEQQKLQAVDSIMSIQSRKNFTLLYEPFNSIKKQGESFSSMPGGSVAALISELSYYNASLENEMVQYCENQIGQTDGDGFFTKISFLIGQNTTHLRKGEVMEITAGEGEFTSKTHPEFRIDGRDISMINGQADYKFKIKEEPGKHLKKVQIFYIDANGRQQSKQMIVEYTVDP